ncbi:MAG: FliI/YscN family ATPase [SAR324 cluster bacterium]|nr:FliI/YscN family ATPase [SAR324 cluster bacterium]MCH8887067.1 FliI/YscN family ATPase [SAR324 cluster bacterium]
MKGEETLYTRQFPNFDTYRDLAKNAVLVRRQGKVVQQTGQIIEAYNPGIAIGGLCTIYNPITQQRVMGEVIGFKGEKVMLMALEQMPDIGPHCRIIPDERPPTVQVGDPLLGRVLNGLGDPIDNKGEILCELEWPLYREPINPMSRRRITDPIDVGVRSINGLLTCGLGQRVGVMSGSGVGKSVLIGMMARHTTADVNVIAMIGERGRETVEFIERELGPEGLERSVLVVATSDQPPLIRTRAAYLATTIAEYFRHQGKNVLFMMDSITRFAMAQREIGLAAGEPPTTKGYPPSVFAALPKLLERTGRSDSEGSITGFYTVLVEGDDPADPIADAVRAIVDGHIVLSRDLASKGQYPAVDVLNSTSRVMTDIVSTQHRRDAQAFVATLATYQEAEDLINIGAYVRGSNPRIDYALDKIESVIAYLKQPVEEKSSLDESQAVLEQMFADFQP